MLQFLVLRLNPSSNGIPALGKPGVMLLAADLLVLILLLMEYPLGPTVLGNIQELLREVLILLLVECPLGEQPT